MPSIVNTFADISDQYDVAFVDLWGCMHNGITPFQASVDAMQSYRERGGKVVLVTNAHPGSLSLKVEKTQLDEHIDELISTHQFGVTKESQLLWQQLQVHLNFDPAKTLFVDDSQVILDAAKEYGIAYTLGITNPDSKMPENKLHGHVTTNDYLRLLDDII